MWKISLILLFTSLPSWGFRLTQDFSNGFYWASLPVNVKVEESNVSRKNLLRQLSQDAIGEWESRTGLSLWDYTEAGTPNIIRWSNNFAAETGMDAMSVLAVAVRYTNGPYFARAEIIINGNHPLNADTDNLLTTITHELGHTMGLDHSENMNAVMAPTLQDPYRGLHNDDVQGMNVAHQETEHRQVTRYVSPLAYEETEQADAMSCGTVTTQAASQGQGAVTVAAGMLIAFVRKIFNWFKSLLARTDKEV